MVQKRKHCVWRSLQMKVPPLAFLPPLTLFYFLQPFWILGLIFQTSEQLINTIDDEREITNLAYTDTEQNPHQKFVDFPELVLSLQKGSLAQLLSASSQSILHTLKSFSLAGSWQHHWKEGRDRQTLQRRGKSWQCVNWKLGRQRLAEPEKSNFRTFCSVGCSLEVPRDFRNCRPFTQQIALRLFSLFTLLVKLAFLALLLFESAGFKSNCSCCVNKFVWQPWKMPNCKLICHGFHHF